MYIYNFVVTKYAPDISSWIYFVQVYIVRMFYPSICLLIKLDQLEETPGDYESEDEPDFYTQAHMPI